MKTRLHPAALLAALAATAHAQDTRSFAESLFLPSGPGGTTTPFQLWSGTPPQPGNTTELVLMAPGRTLGGVLVAGRAGTGSWLPTPCGHALLIYLDLATQIGSIPVPLAANGRGTAWLSLPWNNSLVGIDLAFQAWAFSGACDFAASNLVVGNIGSAPSQGNAIMGHPYGPVTLPGYATWSVGGTLCPVLTNMTSGNTQPYRLTGIKTPGAGPLQLVDQFGAVVAQAAAADAAFSLLVNVAPNRRLFWRNGGGATLTIHWSLSAVWF